jgi:hypothetical protein
MRITLLIFMMLLGSHLSAKETLMVCDTSNSKIKRYYKLVDPWFGENSIEQKIDGQWNKWCREPYCKLLEVYESGATTISGYETSFKYSDSIQEVVANQMYYMESQIWLDFEFLFRKKEYRLYADETKTKQLRYRKDLNKTYNCKLR